MDAPSYRFGLIGKHIAFSLSPLLHSHLAQREGRVAFCSLYDIDPDGLAAMVARIRAGELDGLNVTSPYKLQVIRYLDGLTDTARRTGAVNTLYRIDGDIVGDNTDAAGAQAVLGTLLQDHIESAIIIGTGGAARAAAMPLLARASLGSLTFRSRNPEFAEPLLNQFSDNRCAVRSIHEPYRADLIVNATPVGRDDADATPVDSSLLHEVRYVFDMNYVPLKTRLMAAATKCGASTVGGLPMFVVQGTESYRLWTGRQPQVDGIEEFLLEKLRSRTM